MGARTAFKCVAPKFLHLPYSSIVVVIEVLRNGLTILSSSWSCMMLWCMCNLLCSILANAIASSFVTHSLLAVALAHMKPPSFHSFPPSMKYPSAWCATLLRSLSVVASMIPNIASTISLKTHSFLNLAHGGDSSVTHSGCITLPQVQCAVCIYFFDFFRNFLELLDFIGEMLCGCCAT